MVAELEEVLVHLVEAAVGPEAPGTNLGTRDHEGPRAPRVGKDGVAVRRAAEPDGGRSEVIVAVRRGVRVAALEDERREPPGMIVLRTRVVGREPVMDADRTERRLEPPPDDVRALRQAERLAELQDELLGPRAWIRTTDLRLIRTVLFQVIAGVCSGLGVRCCNSSRSDLGSYRRSRFLSYPWLGAASPTVSSLDPVSFAHKTTVSHRVAHVQELAEDGGHDPHAAKHVLFSRQPRSPDRFVFQSGERGNRTHQGVSTCARFPNGILSHSVALQVQVSRIDTFGCIAQTTNAGVARSTK